MPRIPAKSACGGFGAACFDELPPNGVDLPAFYPPAIWTRLDLTWRVANSLENLSPDGQLDAVQRAFEAWAGASGLSFEQVDGEADITITFERDEHGDPYPFDGSNGVLGHTFFPSAGDRRGQIHLNAEKFWTLGEGGEFDLLTTLLHEIGHALGLEHSTNQAAVMFPGYKGPWRVLTSDDVDAIQRRYGDPDGEVLPTPFDRTVVAPPNLFGDGSSDTDDDGIPDPIEVFVFRTDWFKADSDGDADSDFVEVFFTRTNPLVATPAPEMDADGDGLSDSDEIRIFGTNPVNSDTDGDGLSDAMELFDLNTDPLSADSDEDGVLDNLDDFPNDPRFPLDCNDNGFADDQDIAQRRSQDVNGNGIPDECDPDCNKNGVADHIDIANGTSEDADEDGVPDECISPGDPGYEDCNENDDADGIDIVNGTSQDLNANGVPDECDPDCNGNGTPDHVDIERGLSMDINQNGIPDECDPDCNGNDRPDDLDIERGLSADINQNGIPDECEVQLGDLNCDGRFDGLDITAFFLALTDPEAYAIVYPDCGPFGSPAGRAGE